MRVVRSGSTLGTSVGTAEIDDSAVTPAKADTALKSIPLNGSMSGAFNNGATPGVIAGLAQHMATASVSPINRRRYRRARTLRNFRVRADLMGTGAGDTVTVGIAVDGVLQQSVTFTHGVDVDGDTKENVTDIPVAAGSYAEVWFSTNDTVSAARRFSWDLEEVAT